MLKLIIDGINPDGYAVECDTCETSTARVAGALPTKESAEAVASAFDFTMVDYRHVCPACRVSGVAR